MTAIAPHGARDWAQQTSMGQRVFELPPSLRQFVSPPIRVFQPAPSRMNFSGLGNQDLQSGDPQVDVAVAWGQHSALLALLNELAEVDMQAHTVHSATIGDFGKRLSALTNRATDLGSAESTAWYSELTALESEMAALQGQLHADIRSGRQSREVAAVGWTGVAMGVAAVTGIYLFTRRSRRRRR